MKYTQKYKKLITLMSAMPILLLVTVKYFLKHFITAFYFFLLEINLYEAGNDIAKRRFNEMSTVRWRQLNQKNNEICPIIWFTPCTWSETSLKYHNLPIKVVCFLHICEWDSPKYKGRQHSAIGQSVKRCQQTKCTVEDSETKQNYRGGEIYQNAK